MTKAAAEMAGDFAGNIWTSYSTRDRTLLSIGSITSFWIFWTVGGLVGFPRDYGYNASILCQPSAILIMITAAVVLVACVLMTSFFANVVHFEAGLFCAAIGMLALSIRGGSMRYVLMESTGSGIFLKLAVELAFLFVVMGAGWMTLTRLRDMKMIRGEPHGEDDPDDLPAQGAMALGVQIVIMIILMLLLAQTDKKAQVVWSVAISSCLAAMAAHSLFPSRPSTWYWTTPLIVGVVGYLLAWSGGNMLPGGAVGGVAPALARPLPLDYASVGVAGSLMGYWVSRRWQYEKNEDPQEPDQVEDALEHPPQNV